MYFQAYAWNYLTMFTTNRIIGVNNGSYGHLVDTFLNIMLCLPAALALCLLQPRKLLLYTALAVLPCFVWQYRLFITDTTLFMQWRSFIYGALSVLLTLPITVLIVHFGLNLVKPNYAIKGTSA